MILCQILIMSGESPTEYLKQKSTNITYEIILACVKSVSPYLLKVEIINVLSQFLFSTTQDPSQTLILRQRSQIQSKKFLLRHTEQITPEISLFKVNNILMQSRTIQAQLILLVLSFINIPYSQLATIQAKRMPMLTSHQQVGSYLLI